VGPVRHYARAWFLHALARIKCRCRWPLAWSSRCPAVTPDSPVYTGHVRWIIAEQPLQFPEASELLRPLFLGAPDTVRCTLDSPVNYSGVASGFSRRRRVWVGVFWCTGHCPVYTGQSGAPDHLLQYLVFLIGLLWTFGTCITYTLEQTS
jgi:hypothetical protein